MLNELALVRNGIAKLDSDLLRSIHKSLTEPGKTNLLRVVLAPEQSDNCIAELDYLQGDTHKNYWTHGDGNQNQFPAVKLKSPLRPAGVTEYRQWKQANKNPSVESHMAYLELLRSRYVIDLSSLQSWPKYRGKLEQRADIYRNGLSGDSYIVASLLSAFLRVEENGLALLRELDEELWQQCKRTADKGLLDLAALIMFACLAENEALTTKGEMPTRPTLLFDLIGDGFYSAANKHWLPAISAVLFQVDAQSKQRLGTCAISGRPNSTLVTSTFPSQKCNHLGKVTTYSRKKGVPTYQRYRREAAESMAVSADLADELASALRYLNTKKKGVTWDVAPGETASGDLLLSFCQALPDVPVVRLLSHESDILGDEDDYELEAKEVCEQFKGVDTIVMAQVDFLIIRKVNDGVQKVIFSSSQLLENLESAAGSWCQANRNTPAIALMFKKDRKRTFSPPFTISPKKFALLFKKKYDRTAKSKPVGVPGLPFSEVMALFLNENRPRELARRLLNRLLRQYSGLLELAALKQTNPIKHNQDALCAITAIAVLLHKLERIKEVYMDELAYKLGQFCAALDEIHIGYCERERKGQLPGRLIGNQAYSAAVNSPLKALNITAQRAAVYQAWAKKLSLQPDEKIGDKRVINAKYAFIWMRKHCEELHVLMPKKLGLVTAESRAELLLGYLAGREMKKAQDKEQQGENADAI